MQCLVPKSSKMSIFWDFLHDFVLFCWETFLRTFSNYLSHQRILGSELHISIFCNILGKKMTQTRKIMFRVSGTRRKHAQEQDMIIITTGHAAEVRPTPLELGARAFLR